MIFIYTLLKNRDLAQRFLFEFGRKLKILFQKVACQKNGTGTPTQGYAYCSYQEKQQTAKSKERIDKLAATQTVVNPFFNAIYCFSSMSKHAPHSSSSLYHPSNMKLLEVHIFCFLFTEKGSSSTLNFIKVNTLKKWESFYRTSGTSASQVEFFFRESRNQMALKTYRQTDIEGLIQVTVLCAWKDLKNGRLR